MGFDMICYRLSKDKTSVQCSVTCWPLGSAFVCYLFGLRLVFRWWFAAIDEALSAYFMTCLYRTYIIYPFMLLLAQWLVNTNNIQFCWDAWFPYLIDLFLMSQSIFCPRQNFNFLWHPMIGQTGKNCCSMLPETLFPCTLVLCLPFSFPFSRSRDMV